MLQRGAQKLKSARANIFWKTKLASCQQALGYKVDFVSSNSTTPLKFSWLVSHCMEKSRNP